MSYLSDRLREQAFLNAGIHIELRDERQEEVIQKNFCYEGGISSFVEYINKKKHVDPIHPEVIYFAAKNSEDTISVEVAMQYTDSYNELMDVFVSSSNPQVNVRSVLTGVSIGESSFTVQAAKPKTVAAARIIYDNFFIFKTIYRLLVPLPIRFVIVFCTGRVFRLVRFLVSRY